MKALFTAKALVNAAALSLGLAAGAASAADCSCEARDGGLDTVLELDSQSGKKLALRFPTSRVTTATTQAFLCSDVAATLELAKLWMPDHGHGSRPTILTAASPTCTIVDRVRFSMTGGWEIQATFADADKAVFAFDVGAP